MPQGEAIKTLWCTPQEGRFVSGIGIKWRNCAAGIEISLGIGCFMKKSPCFGEAQVALFFLLLGDLTCFDLFRGAKFP
jgi:hypothetical protein